MFVRFLVFLTTLLMCACSRLPEKNTEQMSQIKNQSIERQFKFPKLLPDSYFGKRQDIITVNEVYSLSKKQKHEFLTYFNDVQNKSIEPHRRIYSYLEDSLNDFNYYSDTLIASESLKQNKGNCLSLAILTKSLANLAHVEITYQLVETAPVFQKSGSIILSSQHVRTALFPPKNPDSEGFLIFRGRVYIDYFATYGSHVLRDVEEGEFQSMYYTNKAIESLIQKDKNRSFWYLKEALNLEPNHSHAINMMALLHEKLEAPEIAEQLYKYGIEQSKDTLDLLNNYHSLLKFQGRIVESSKIAKKIGSRNESNPFKWISLGNSAYNSKEYSKAIRYYRRANKLAPYLHDGFAGIARSKYQQGKVNQAKTSISNALANTFNDTTRKIYQAKLDMLSELITKNSPVIIESRR